MKLVDLIKSKSQIFYCFRGFFNDYILKYEFKNVYQKIIVVISLLRTKDLSSGPFYLDDPNKFKNEINKFLKENEVPSFASDYEIKLDRFNKKRYKFYIEESSKIYIYDLRD